MSQVAGLFLKLGFTAFGGPAAHIAMMHDEVVKRRRWLDDRDFLDLLGATHLIPGPNSTEMAIHIGFRRAGPLGSVVAGACFILPAATIVMALAWVYVGYGSTPTASGLLYGIKPAVIAIIVMALWDLGRKALKSPWTIATALTVVVLYLLRVNEIALLLGGALVVMVAGNASRIRPKGLAVLIGFPTALKAAPWIATAFTLPVLFFTFLKIGAILYGSGYVLLAFLRAEFVTRLGWLTDRQLLDAIAVGQVTPGPVFTTATFVGYLLGGPAGALLATLGIFLPSFVYVAISNPVIPRLRESPWVGGLLDGVNAASLGLMAGVTWELGRASLVDPVTLGIALVALVLLVRFRINSTWLVLVAALAGLLRAG
ncbi:MAG: chromate efflux transporter [Anaerolineales bacterium]